MGGRRRCGVDSSLGKKDAEGERRRGVDVDVLSGDAVLEGWMTWNGRFLGAGSYAKAKVVLILVYVVVVWRLCEEEGVKELLMGS